MEKALAHILQSVFLKLSKMSGIDCYVVWRIFENLIGGDDFSNVWDKNRNLKFFLTFSFQFQIENYKMISIHALNRSFILKEKLDLKIVDEFRSRSLISKSKLCIEIGAVFKNRSTILKLQVDFKILVTLLLYCCEFSITKHC